jgi:WD40 repeat protein/DNA-binding SARP family transcriptional activator
MLEYRVLGGFAVENGDGDVGLGGSRQRRLLAVLLVHRNGVVSVDRLAEVVFAGEPTPAASTTLRSYVARLRRVVEVAGSGSRVVTQAPGYRLDAADEAVDASRFEALVASGRTLLSRGEADAATRALRDGLALWRGDAYAEFADEDWARGVAQRLAELRLVACEALADAELGAGRPHEAVSLLDGLVSEHPLRESLHARLMLALYRSGRQVDALRAYQGHREALVVELGLEPSPELAALEGRILAHDESLAEADARGSALRGYRLGERLGTGRDGTVFAARLAGVDRDIAIRVVPDAVADAPGFVRTFDADARRVAALRDAAVVPVQDWWREPGAAYVVMRRMRGGTLRDRLQRGPLGGEEAARALARVGGALVAAAEAGVGHGRLSAECVLLDDAGDAYLGDFALGTRDGRDSSGDMVALAALAGELVGGHHLPTGHATAPDPLAAVVASAAGAAPHATAPEALAEFVDAAVAALSGAPATRRARHANPYKGLRAFDEPDAADFFGRDRFVDELVARLAAPRPAGRLALVVGGSGSGKSSIVRAGLLPRIRRGAVPGSASWFVATMVPGKTPFEELADALRLVAVVEAGSGAGVDGLARELAATERGVHDVVGRLVPPDGELLLVVDQLEELFTLAPVAEQRTFLDALAVATSAVDSRLRVVATLRADFYDRPLAFERFAGAVGEATVAVGAMSAAELEAAVVGPAERVGAAVEPALVAELVAATVHEPAALPSLQFTLTELADRSEDGTLTLGAYRDLGGVDGAIAARAEDLVLSLRPDARAGVRRLFQQLVVVGPTGEPTRRRALVSEVESAVPDGDVEGLDGVVETWAQARLLTLDRDPDSRQPTVEVAHEALLREWPRLRDWLVEDREDIVALAHLRDAASSWEALGRDAGGLYRGVRLDATLGLADRRRSVLPPAERAFLDASSAERDSELRREAGRVRRLRAQLVAVAVALVVSLAVGALAVEQRNRAVRQGDIAGARELAAAANANLDRDPERSILLALHAVDRAREGGGEAPGDGALPEAEEALHNAVTASRAEMRVPRSGGAVDWSPAGDTFVTEGPEDSGEIDIRDAASGESVRRWYGHDPDVNQVAYGAGGSLLLTTGDDAAARLWDPETGEQLHALVGQDMAWGPSISDDGRLFAASWPLEGVTRVADVATGRVIREVPLAEANHTALAPEGDRIAVASWGAAPTEVVDIASGDVLMTLAAHDNDVVMDVAWSPDGASIATSGGDGSTVVWDAATGERRFALLGHEAGVADVDWNPDSRLLATASEDGTAKVWRLDEGGGRQLMTLTAQDMRAGVAGVAFSPDGARVLTGARNIASARVWDVGTAGDAEVATIPTLTHATNGIALTGNGRHLFAPGGGGSVALWDLERPDVDSSAPVRTFGGDPPEFQKGSTVRTRAGEVEPSLVSADPAGEVMAALVAPTADWTRGVVQAWDVASGRLLFAVRDDRETLDLAWSPDGRVLAASGVSAGTAEGDQPGPAEVVLYGRDGRRLAEVTEEPGFGIGEIRFSEDGRHLVVGRFPLGPGGHGLRVWDWRRGTVVGGFDAPDSTWVGISGDGRLAVSVRPDPDEATDTITVWDVAGEREVTTLGAQDGSPWDISFSHDGGTVAVAGGDGTVTLWDAHDGHKAMTLRGHFGIVSAVAFPDDGSQLATASADGTVRIWALHLDDLEKVARANVTRELTTDECRRYLHEPRCPG